MKKKIIYAMILLLAMSCYFNKAQSQSSSATNAVGTPNTPFTPGVDYLGWASGVNLPLNIGNYDPQLINFFTNANPSGQIDPTLTNNTSFGYLTFGSLTSESQIPTRFSFTSSGLQSERRRIYIKYLNRIQYISDKYKAKTSANGVLA